jgi:hypothetical protein
MKFEYDPEKNSQNIKKHGVSFEEAITVFADPHLLFLEDHSDSNEVRTIAIGESSIRRQLFVVHCSRSGKEHEEIIRIISARKTTKAERVRIEELRF